MPPPITTPNFSLDGKATAQPKKQKPRSLPPPGEAFQAKKKEPKAKSKAKSATKKPTAPKKAPAKSKAFVSTANAGGGVASGNGVQKPVPARRGLPPKVKQPGLFNSVWNNTFDVDSSYEATEAKVEKQSVLVRATATTAKIKDAVAQGKASKKSSKSEKAKEDADQSMVFRVMDLPKELRATVWRYAVVNPNAFIFPESEKGHEQPDLAMVCRLVRSEVLPIFYAENIFAVKLFPENEPSYYPGDEGRKGKKNIVLQGGIPVLKEWAHALAAAEGKPDWWTMTRQWAFSYVSKAEQIFGRRPALECSQNKSLVVSVNFSKKQLGEIFWDANVEVHRDARCVLPGNERCGICSVKTVPEWLNGPVIAVTEAAQGSYVTHKMVIELAEYIKLKVGRLAEFRCDEFVQRSVGEASENYENEKCAPCALN